MARNRDPAREKAKELWKEAGGDKAPKGILKEIADKLALSEGTVRGWKAKDKWSVPKKKAMERSDKNMERSNKKNIIKQAETIVVSGGTIKEASEKVGLPVSTIGEYSRKENWIEKRIDFLNNLYEKVKDEKLEKHLQNRIESITHLEYVRKKALKQAGTVVDKDIMLGYKALIDTINNSLDGEAKLLGVISPDKLADIEMKKIQMQFEKEKFIINAELKRLELEVNKIDNGETEEDTEQFDKDLDKWTNEVWK